MKAWVLKPEYAPGRGTPDDMMCVQLDDDWLLFIQFDGGWDVSSVDCGFPSERHFEEFEAFE